MQYLKAEPVYHTFLLSDLECYGFEHEFQQVYMQEKEDWRQYYCSLMDMTKIL